MIVRRAVLALAVLAALLALRWGIRGEPAPISAADPAEPLDPVPFAGPRDVECQLAALLRDGEALWVDEVEPESLAPLELHDAVVEDDFFRFVPVNADGVGWVKGRRYHPKAIGWADGACLGLVELAPRLRIVRGEARGTIEAGAVAVHSECEDGERGQFSGSLRADGTFQLDVPAGQRCSVYVDRVFGEATLASEPVALPEGDGDVMDLVLEVPAVDGLGAALVPVDDGLRIYGIEPGSPADRAGLQVQDLLLRVDGVPAVELAADELEQEVELRLEVVRGEEALRIHVRP